MMEDRVGYIRVVNHNKSVVGRYAGKDYHFETNKPIDVPEIVAAHVFAFGKDDKSQALNRLGWARTSDELEAGMAMLKKVTFDDPPEMIEAPSKRKPGRPAKETGVAGPPVTAGGTEGGGFNAPPDGPKIGGPEPDDSEDDDKF
jgi:hypothetical protein